MVVKSSNTLTPALPFWRRARRRGYYLLTITLVELARRLPQRLVQGTCRGLARMALRWRTGERGRAQANLAVVYPELDAAARDRLMRASADALARNLYLTLTLPRQAKRDFPEVREDGALQAIMDLRAEGRGVLLLTGHLGCWELLGAWLAQRLGGLAVVTGAIHNEPVDRLLQRQRRQLGMTPLPREGDLRPLLRQLQAGGIVAILMDQNTRVRSMDIPFFGRPAPTAVGFAKLALRYGIPVLPVAISWQAGANVVSHLPVLRPEGGTDPAAVRQFLTRCNTALATFIQRNPAEWVWFHQRWPKVAPATATAPAGGPGD